MLCSLLRAKLAFPSLQPVLILYIIYLNKQVQIKNEDAGVPNRDKCHASQDKETQTVCGKAHIDSVKRQEEIKVPLADKIKKTDIKDKTMSPARRETRKNNIKRRSRGSRAGYSKVSFHKECS